MRYIYWAVFAAVLILVVCVRKMIRKEKKGIRALDVVNLFLLALGLLFFYAADGPDNIQERILSCVHLGIIALSFGVTLLDLKSCWVVSAFLGITYVLLAAYPMFYNFVYPYNNFGEDLLWAVYSPLALGVILVLAAGLTGGIWLCVRFLGTRHPVKSMSIALGFVAFVAVVVFGAKEAVKPPQRANDVEPYEYLAAAENKDGKWGFINERGQVVLPFVYGEYQDSLGYGDTFLAHVSDDTGDYLINEKGKYVREDCTDYIFMDDSQYIIAEKWSGYGIIDSQGRTVTDFTYDDPDALLEDHPELFPRETKEDLQIMSDFDAELFSDYVADSTGNVIIPSDLGYISFSRDHKYFLVNAGWFVTYENTDERFGGCGLYDRQGNPVIPINDSRGLWADNENGWILAQDLDGRYYFTDIHENVMLDLGYDYDNVKGMVGIRRR